MDLSKIKLVVLDLDGTLLDGNGEIGEKSLSLIKQLKERGVDFTIASGRLHSSITPYAEILELNNYIVSLDGALIKHSIDGSILHQAYLPGSSIRKAISLSEIIMTRMVLCGEKEIYYTDSNEVVRDFLDRFGADYKEVSSYYRVADEILEAVFISENKHKLQDIRKKFSFPWSFGIVSTLSNSVSERGMYYLELRKKGSTKAKGVKKIMKRSGLKLNDIAVVGDWYNDIELFDMGAFTAAPANAVAEIANKASFVASKPNTEDGISEFFELLLNHK